MDSENSPLSRRRLLGLVGTAGAAALAGCNDNPPETASPAGNTGGGGSTPTATAASTAGSTPTPTAVPSASLSLSVESNGRVQLQPAMPDATAQEYGVHLGVAAETSGPPMERLELVVNEGTADSVRVDLTEELGQKASYDSTFVVDARTLRTGDNTFRLAGGIGEQSFQSGVVSATVTLPRGWKLDVRADGEYAGIDTSYGNELLHDDFPADGVWDDPPIHDNDLEALPFDDAVGEVRSRLSESDLQSARNATLDEFADLVVPPIHKLASNNNETSGALPSQAPRICASLELAYQEIAGHEATGFAWNSVRLNESSAILEDHGSYAMRDHATDRMFVFSIQTTVHRAPNDSEFAPGGSRNADVWYPLVREYESSLDQRALEEAGARDGYVTGKRITEDMLDSIGSYDPVGGDDDADGYMVDAYQTRVRDLLRNDDIRPRLFRKISNQMKLYKAAKGAAASGARVVVGADAEGSLDSFTLWMENPSHSVGFDRLIDRGLLRSSEQLTNADIEQRLET